MKRLITALLVGVVVLLLGWAMLFANNASWYLIAALLLPVLYIRYGASIWRRGSFSIRTLFTLLVVASLPLIVRAVGSIAELITGCQTRVMYGVSCPDTSIESVYSLLVFGGNWYGAGIVLGSFVATIILGAILLILLSTGKKAAA